MSSTTEEDGFDDVLRRIAATGDPPPQIGTPTRAGRYEVGPRLGRGGLGVVHRARDPKLGRDVALKFVRPELTSGSRGDVMHARLRREAKALAALAHPAIVQVFDVGSVGHQVYIAMELIEGQSLRAWASRPEVDADAIVQAFVRAAEGLAAAHAAGVVHRDFKPDNVLVADDGRVVVVDFGLAVPDPTQTVPSTGSDSGDPRLTKTGTVPGTRGYVAPELRDGGVASPQSDQYAFCVSLHEVLCGALPHGGKPSDALPGALRSIVQRGLDPDPDRRFGSMLELIGALRRRGSNRARIVATSLGAIALLAGAVWVGAAIVRTVERRACADEAVAAIPEPSADEREALGAAIERYVDASPERANAAAFATTLDAWRSAYEDACVAMRGSEELATVRHCFAVRDAELRAAAKALVDRLPPMLADEVAADLLTVAPTPGTCVDPSWLEVQRPSPAADAGDIAALERSLWEARATASAGREADALAQIDRIMSAAEEIGNDRLWARARHVRAGCVRATQGADAATEELERAYEVAAAAREDDVAAAVATSLVEVVYAIGTQDAGALQWGRTAWALVDRLGLRRSLLAAQLHTNVGVTHDGLGEYEAAFAEHEQALEIRRELLGPDALLIAESLANLGGLHLRLARRDEAENAYLRALEIERARLGPHHGEVAKSIASLAAVRQAMGKRRDALEGFEEAREIAVIAAGSQSMLALLYGQEAARLRGEQGELAYAERELLASRRVLAAKLGADHTESLRPWFTLARLYADAGRHDEALDLYAKIQTSLETTVGTRAPNFATVRHAIAQLEQRRGEHASARAAFLEVLELTRESMPPSHPVRLGVLLDLAASERALGMTDSALARCEDVLARAEASPQTPPSTVAKALLERARLRVETDRGKALADAKRALEIFTAQNDETGAAEAKALIEAP